LVITECWEASRKNYGAPRILADLADLGIRTSKKRVARLMAEAGIQGGGVRKKGPKTTRQDKARPPADDLLERDFTADEPNSRWVADIKYVGTWEGYLYLASIIDVCSRTAVGWAMREDLGAELVTEALEMALWRRDVSDGLIHHSDRGCQYTSLVFSKRCEEAGIVRSMGRVGSALDNAMAESFNATIQKELLRDAQYKTRDEARVGIFDYIEGFYNPTRRHSSIGNIAPLEFERRWLDERTVA
jgi:putative transposase